MVLKVLQSPIEVSASLPRRALARLRLQVAPRSQTCEVLSLPQQVWWLQVSLPSAWSRVSQTSHLYQRLVCHEAAAWLPVAYHVKHER